ncbi:UDP-phosphate galactose phosphotransferase [Candidatus Saccharibacteria bacterium CG11_big_fil_rev_8_21_14_0_20_41_19]|nr:sugar transferase [Candidatus Saccharibacteria bacterium]OIP85445.1 MAG: UDP-phosphate galactose phosphotransferase [Candidatus Saccharibacteria bacterium CG2_30_41_52]PIQ71223.1 MAG: UDP-phosphate galactose phosphotransferase [Candidatus Saccharibacteria bacterium CG11_big_fil_rev_8_21_14_0_20_41_19]PIZ59830.1 MAG: sugar transferase [Candidatus Saccharibacteria bacterium CG_4_10_14_0_2_um_filter_41_11]PJC29318.1 MAG: sugar transferase [Candidatus Saccharibacteria bacterium CG_4_9_14_0_2_um_
MPGKNTKFYSLILIIIDTFVLIGAFTIAYIARVQYDPRPLLTNVHAYDYLRAFIFIIPFWILVFAMLGLYQSGTYNRRLVEWAKIALGTFIGILLVIGWQYASGDDILPARLVAVYGMLAAFGLIVFEREVMRLSRSMMFRYGRGVNRVLLIGTTDATSDIARNLANTVKSGYEIIAIAGPKKIVPPELNVRHYSLVESALLDIKLNKITAIIQTDLYNSTERNQKILGAAQSHHIGYSFIPGEAEFYSGKNTVDVFLGYPIITVHQTPLVGWGAIIKRIFDFVVSLILLVILSPVLLVIYIIKKNADPGPAFYISKRLSRFSEPIDLIKFRSMDAKYGSRDAADEFHQMGRDDLAREYEKNRKVENDPRITRIGKFLRDTSLDELPQILNVIKGDLSLVGPRPILPQETKLAHGRTALLHSVKSGVTGMWQVSGRSELTFDERIELELFYAQNWTFWLDIKILFKTVGVVLRKRGAK